MAGTIADRHVWTVDTLEVNPADQLLEVGCGYGVAVSLICDRLTTGTITAIDRSEAMIQKATERNSEHVASGKAIFQTATLAEAELDNSRFNKIFAMNVSDFWNHPANELNAVKPYLQPGGTLYLFYQPPVEQKIQEVTDILHEVLPDYGLHIKESKSENIDPVSAVCIMAELP